MWLYTSTSVQEKALVTWVRVAEKSVKRALNLYNLRYLIIFIYIIYLYMILVRFRLLKLKSIYLLWEHRTKLVAERSYHLPSGQVFLLWNVTVRRHSELGLYFAARGYARKLQQEFCLLTCGRNSCGVIINHSSTLPGRAHKATQQPTLVCGRLASFWR